MKKKRPVRPLEAAVLEYVLKHGSCSIAEVAAALGHLIPASRAARVWANFVAASIRNGHCRAGRSCSAREAVRRGQRHIVGSALKNLANRGNPPPVVRVGRGRYAPSPPKIYQPKETA